MASLSNLLLISLTLLNWQFAIMLKGNVARDQRTGTVLSLTETATRKPSYTARQKKEPIFFCVHLF